MGRIIVECWIGTTTETCEYLMILLTLALSSHRRTRKWSWQNNGNTGSSGPRTRGQFSLQERLFANGKWIWKNRQTFTQHLKREIALFLVVVGSMLFDQYLVPWLSRKSKQRFIDSKRLMIYTGSVTPPLPPRCPSPPRTWVCTLKIWIMDTNDWNDQQDKQKRQKHGS